VVVVGSDQKENMHVTLLGRAGDKFEAGLELSVLRQARAMTRATRSGPELKEESGRLILLPNNEYVAVAAAFVFDRFIALDAFGRFTCMISDYASLYCRHSPSARCRVLSCRLGLGREWILGTPQLYR
jgi:hypothetical protein